MIKRRGETWTTIQCQKCKDCFKVLNDRHLVMMQCPYCDSRIQVTVYNQQTDGAKGALLSAKINCAEQYPKVRKEDAVAYTWPEKHWPKKEDY